MIHRMRQIRRLAAPALAGALLALWPAVATAQTVSGDASAVQANVLGWSTVLAGTGPLADAQDLREASEVSSAILSVGSADVLHAATGGSTNGGETSVASEASLADLALSVAGNSISAAFVMARAFTPAGGVPVGSSEFDALSINGMAVPVSGAPNQKVPLLGGRMVLNEQIASPGGTTVNALHIVIDGLADLVIASANAGIGSGSSTPPPILPPLPLF